MPATPMPLTTIGHSSRPLDAFLALLAGADIDCVVDVRRLPGSRRYPHYNADALSATLAAHGMAYWHLPALCGRRTQGELHGAAAEDFWTNASFARYAAYARGAAFAQGLDELVDRARSARCVLMCSEAVWWRCHRRIIADHLLARGLDVRHIIDSLPATAATLTPGARICDRTVVYPAPARVCVKPADAP